MDDKTLITLLAAATARGILDAHDTLEDLHFTMPETIDPNLFNRIEIKSPNGNFTISIFKSADYRPEALDDDFRKLSPRPSALDSEGLNKYFEEREEKGL